MLRGYGLQFVYRASFPGGRAGGPQFEQDFAAGGPCSRSGGVVAWRFVAAPGIVILISSSFSVRCACFPGRGAAVLRFHDDFLFLFCSHFLLTAAASAARTKAELLDGRIFGIGAGSPRAALFWHCVGGGCHCRADRVQAGPSSALVANPGGLGSWWSRSQGRQIFLTGVRDARLGCDFRFQEVPLVRSRAADTAPARPGAAGRFFRRDPSVLAGTPGPSESRGLVSPCDASASPARCPSGRGGLQRRLRGLRRGECQRWTFAGAAGCTAADRWFGRDAGLHCARVVGCGARQAGATLDFGG